MALNYTTTFVVTTPFTISGGEEVLLIDLPTPASVILPTGAGVHAGRAYYIKDYSGLAKQNPITITAAGGKTIDGGPTAFLGVGYSHIQVVYDGTNWMTIA